MTDGSGAGGPRSPSPRRSTSADPSGRARLRIPAHVAVMLGLSTAGYAVGLAAVTSLQSNAESAVVADRAPFADGVAALGDGHDRLARQLDGAAARYGRTADEFASLSDRLVTVEGGLAALADAVKTVDGASRALPASVRLPPVVRSVRAAAVPIAHATSGGSAP